MFPPWLRLTRYSNGKQLIPDRMGLDPVIAAKVSDGGNTTQEVCESIQLAVIPAEHAVLSHNDLTKRTS
jgi:hypothetical protein